MLAAFYIHLSLSGYLATKKERVAFELPLQSHQSNNLSKETLAPTTCSCHLHLPLKPFQNSSWPHSDPSVPKISEKLCKTRNSVQVYPSCPVSGGAIYSAPYHWNV